MTFKIRRHFRSFTGTCQVILMRRLVQLRTQPVSLIWSVFWSIKTCGSILIQDSVKLAKSLTDAIATNCLSEIELRVPGRGSYNPACRSSASRHAARDQYEEPNSPEPGIVPGRHTSSPVAALKAAIGQTAKCAGMFSPRTARPLCIRCARVASAMTCQPRSWSARCFVPVRLLV